MQIRDGLVPHMCMTKIHVPGVALGIAEVTAEERYRFAPQLYRMQEPLPQQGQNQIQLLVVVAVERFT